MIKQAKTITTRKSLSALVSDRLQDDNSTCVFVTLEEYIFRVKLWRQKSSHNQLLLSHFEFSSPVKTCTLSGWIFQVLKCAGINTKMFKSHSVRAASISKAKTWVYLLVKFWKRVGGSKNQDGNTYNKQIVKSVMLKHVKS